MAIEILSYGLLKDIALLIWRRIGQRSGAARGEAPAKLARVLLFSDARRVDVPLGWRAAIVDDERVQAILTPGHYRRWQLQRLRRRLGLGPGASLATWRAQPARVHARANGIFAMDSHEFETDVTAIVVMRPEIAIGQPMPDLPRDAGAVIDVFTDVVRRVAMGEVSGLEGRTAAADTGLPERLRHKLEPELGLRLAARGVALVAVERVALTSQFLAWVREQESRAQMDRERLQIAEEHARVRGALRKDMFAGKLAEVKDRDDFEAIAAAVRQNARLRELVLRGELQQAELDATLKEIEVWKRRQAAFDETYAWVLERQGRALESAARFADAIRDRVQGDRSAFTPQEREQIARCLDAAAGNAVSAGDVLAAVQRGVEIPVGIFDPFRRVYGVHTLKIGSQWRVFDGDTLWTIRLCGVGTRRHGFLWRKESPVSARFDVEGRPGNRVSKKDVSLTQPDSIAVGPHEVRCVFVSGRPYEITVKLGAARAEPLHWART